MYGLVYKISKFFRGNTPVPPLREGSTPSRTHPNTAFSRARGGKRCRPNVEHKSAPMISDT